MLATVIAPMSSPFEFNSKGRSLTGVQKKSASPTRRKGAIITGE
jgi:hypothetical protein